jgi:hypothetical protein
LSKRRIEKVKGNETGYNISNPKTSLSGKESTLHNIHTYIHTWRKDTKSKTKPKEIKNKNKKKQVKVKQTKIQNCKPQENKNWGKKKKGFKAEL